MSILRLRRPWLTVPALGLSLLLVGCAGSSGEPAVDGSTPSADVEKADQAAESDPPAAVDSEGDADSDSDSDAEGEGDAECFAAFALVRMIDPGMRVRAEQGPLTDDDVTELFADTAPYVDGLSAEVRVQYDTLHDAALSAVGLEDAEVDAILDRPEVQTAVATLSDTLKTMSACM